MNKSIVQNGFGSCVSSQESVVEGRLPEIRIVLYLVGSAYEPCLSESTGQGRPGCILLPPGAELPDVPGAAPPLVCTAFTHCPFIKALGPAGGWIEYRCGYCKVPPPCSSGRGGHIRWSPEHCGSS